MAEENTQETPAFNQDALAGWVQGAVRSTLETMVQEAEGKRQAAMEQERARREAAARGQDPVHQLVAPVVAPHLARMDFESKATRDYVDFYTSESAQEDGRIHFKDRIEKVFDNCVAQGKAMDRETCWNYVQGRDRKDIDKYTQDRQAAEESRASAYGGGVPNMPFGGGRGQTMMPAGFKDLSLEDMEKALAGHSF